MILKSTYMIWQTSAKTLEELSETGLHNALCAKIDEHKSIIGVGKYIGIDDRIGATSSSQFNFVEVVTLKERERYMELLAILVGLCRWDDPELNAYCGVIQ